MEPVRMREGNRAARIARRLADAAAGAAIWGVLAVAPPVQATILMAPVGFSASQSMWGSGGSLDFGAAGRFGFNPLWVDYDFGASTGTVEAQFNGALRVDYPSWVDGPGLAGVRIGFSGDPGGGALSSYLGAWARVKLAGISVLSEDYVLDPAVTFRPTIGGRVAASDSFAAAGAGIDLVLFKAGFELDLEQNDTFYGTGIGGTLAYGKRGSGVVQEVPFLISGDAGTTLDVALTDTGDWDFALKDIRLESSFALDFDLGLVAYEEHIAGVEFCRACFWGICIPYPCGIKYDRNDYELFGVDVYDGRPFSLAFNTIADAGAFTVEVVPAPPTLLLLAGGLAVFARLRRRPARASG